MSKIKSIHARQLIDCKTRGIVECVVTTEGGAVGMAASPTGTSVGSAEAAVLRDGPQGGLCGTSVHKAVEIVNSVIAPALNGIEVTNQDRIDQIMLQLDATARKEKLGGNSIFSVSAACLSAASGECGLEVHDYLSKGKISSLPLPIVNMFNGGRYPDADMKIQEFGVIPCGAANMEEAVDMLISIFHKTGELIGKKGKPAQIANYFGWRPLSDDPEEHFELIAEAAESLGYSGKYAFYTDCAASEFYDDKTDTYDFMGQQLSAFEFMQYISGMTEKYPFWGVEDVLNEKDMGGFRLASELMNDLVIVGDDNICTNISYAREAASIGAVEGMVFKPNQVGTITEAMAAYRFAEEQGWYVIPSVRAGGMVEDIVKELAVGLQAPLVKCGAPRSGERISFLNTLLRAADEYPEAGFRNIGR